MRDEVPYVMLCGGEPLLVPHFLAVAEQLGQAGVLLKIETNGQLFDEAMAAKLARLPVRSVQISLDGDTARGGVDVGDPAAVDRLCAQVAEAEALQLVGLMAIAPLEADPDMAFGALADEHRRVLRNHPGAVELSAGMSHDLEAAVRHGSTCVRVGTALMGERPLTSP